MDRKELFFEADTRKHQQIAGKHLLLVAKNFINRAMNHDNSKLVEPERSAYVEPVYILNTEKPPFGSERYKEVTDLMGKGWEHHKANNDHHIEFFLPYSVQTLNDPIMAMDLFALMEMVCDWIAAAERSGNEPVEALNYLTKKYPMSEQLQAVIRNTMQMIEQEAINGKG